MQLGITMDDLDAARVGASSRGAWAATSGVLCLFRPGNDASSAAGPPSSYCRRRRLRRPDRNHNRSLGMRSGLSSNASWSRLRRQKSPQSLLDGSCPLLGSRVATGHGPPADGFCLGSTVWAHWRSLESTRSRCSLGVVVNESRRKTDRREEGFA